MLIKIFTLPFNSSLGRFNDDELREFLKDKELVNVRDYLFVRNELPYLALIIKYFPYSEENEQKLKPQRVKDESWKALLSDENMGLYNLLRDWRSERSKKEGVPPYILLTNKQLAEVSSQRPQSLANLIKIDGIGQKKADRYGGDILRITKIDIGKDTQPKNNDNQEKN